MKIHSYGVFVSNAIPYLHQSKSGAGVDCLGQNLPSPFELDIPAHLKRYGEPHALDITQPPSQAWDDKLTEFMDNAFVDLYLPKPNVDMPPSIVFIKEKSMDPFPVLKKLADLCSLNALSTVIYEAGMEDNYRNQLRLTNLGPLSLIGVSVKSSMPIFNVTEYAKISARNLVVTGHPDIPTPKDALDYTDHYNAAAALIKNLSPDIDMKRIGAHFFKNWMQLYHTSLLPKADVPA